MENQASDKQHSADAEFFSGLQNVSTRHHRCSGGLIHRAVLLAAGTGACTGDRCVSGVLRQKKHELQPKWERSCQRKQLSLGKIVVN